MDKDLELQLLKQIEEVNMQKQQESTVPKTLNNNMEIRVRPYKSKFTGKLLHNGIVVDSFNNSEEYAEVRYNILVNYKTDEYSFIFDFDEEQKEYKMDKFGYYNFEFPKYDNVLLIINMALRAFQLHFKDDSLFYNKDFDTYKIFY